MKRAIAAVLSMCIVLCMASCGGEEVRNIERTTEKTTVSTTAATTAENFAVQTTTEAVTETTTTLLTTEATTPSESETETLTESETETESETFTEPETTYYSEPETTYYSEPETTAATTTTTQPTTTTTRTMSTEPPSATTTTKKTTVKPSETSSQSKTTAVTTTKPKQTTTAPAPKAKTADTSSKLYYFPKAATIYDKKKNKVGTISAGCLYSGHYDPNYPEFVVVNYLYSEYLVVSSCVSVRSDAKILETAAIGQMGGNIWGQAACGPTAAAILANSQLGTSWAKDDLILYCENKKLNDQGSLRSGGGITAPNLIKLIESYSGGTVKASNVFGTDPSSILKGLIDKGERSIVVVQYTSSIVTHYYSGTHFVVICGYEYIGGSLYFYYADPYYSYNGRSLLRVNASTLAASMNMVAKEPRCIITVKSK